MDEKNERIADIIAEKRRQAEAIERVCAERMGLSKLASDYLVRELVTKIRREADRLEAAWKREKAAIEADALAVGGLVEASRATTEKSSAVGDAAHKRKLSKKRPKNGVDFGQLGNGAKMRKALLFVKQYFDKIDPFNIETYTFAQIEVDYIKAAISAALAAPPRNCDVGTAQEQEERYLKLKREHVDRLARCPAVGPSFFFPDSLYWAQMPYEAKMGGNDGV